MPLLNYTSDVPVEKTAGEIANILRKGGASAVLTEYDEAGQYVSHISFRIKLHDKDISFRLPCDWKPVYEVMFKDVKTPQQMFYDKKKQENILSNRKEQALKTAWRIIKDWTEAQMALVETQMVRTEQVFLPYAVMANGKTLSEHMETNPEFLLGSGN